MKIFRIIRTYILDFKKYRYIKKTMTNLGGNMSQQNLDKLINGIYAGSKLTAKEIEAKALIERNNLDNLINQKIKEVIKTSQKKEIIALKKSLDEAKSELINVKTKNIKQADDAIEALTKLKLE